MKTETATTHGSGTEGQGTLESLWPIQNLLNRRTGVDCEELGTRLRQLESNGAPIPVELRMEIGRALKWYADALEAECHELRDCLAWKHWYLEAKQGRHYELLDLQNARVEIVDALFFWMGICQLLGLGPDDVRRIYEQKCAIVTKRLDEERTQAEHGQHERENRAIR